MFGSSGLQERPRGLVLDNYLDRNFSRNTDQKKVNFRAADTYVTLPGIHEVLSGQKQAVQVDIHPHDLYYNHYRCKSFQDHSVDPLRLSPFLCENHCIGTIHWF